MPDYRIDNEVDITLTEFTRERVEGFFGEPTDRDLEEIDQAAQNEDDGLVTYFLCPGCDFPHNSEQQAHNCCPPAQVWVCPKCGGLRPSTQAAIECCE